MAVVGDAVRGALYPSHYPGRGGRVVRFVVALIFVKIALAAVFAIALLFLFVTGNF
jgi:hypothetical protein